MQPKRVVITGLGAISPLGNTVHSLVDGVASGRCAVQRMQGWEQYTGLRSQVGAPSTLENEAAIPRQYRRSMSRMSIFSVQAAEQAISDAKITPEDMVSGRLGCIIGSTMGGTQSISEAFETMLPHKDFSLITSMRFFQCFSHTAVMNVSQCLKLNGYIMATSAACASALQAIGVGYDLVRIGTQDMVLCGGAEELHPIATGSFDVLYAASKNFNNEPRKASRPFDRDRDGVVCGEGSGIVVLEDYEHAVKRGANMYGEIIGYSTCGSGDHISHSSKEAMALCMRQALKSASVSPNDIDYVNAHATGTLQGDREEAAAIKEVIGTAVPVSALKGYMGHTLGASGTIELIVCLHMMANGVIYPSYNLDHVADDCAGINHVRAPLRSAMDVFLKNSFAFGGINATLICKKLTKETV